MYVARSMKACEEAKELIQECADMRIEIADLKKKNKEMTLTMNKVKTESKSLSKQDKAWKDASWLSHRLPSRGLWLRCPRANIIAQF